MKRTILLGALVSLALLPAFAQDASSDFDAPAQAADTAAAPAFDWGTLKYSGDQEFSYRVGAYDPATRTGAGVDSKLAAEYKFGGLKVVAAGQVRDNEYVPGETAAFYTLGPVKVGVGLQEFSWGVADKKNPTDTLNARDYRHGANAPRLVNPAASAAVYPADWMSLEAVYEPWKEETKFPTDFQAKTQEGLNANRTKVLDGLQAKIDYYTSLGAPGASGVTTYTNLKNALSASYSPKVTAASTVRDFSNPVYGGRANFFLPGLDLSLSYLYDRDSFYTPVVTMGSYVSGNFQLPASIDLQYKRIHRFGLNAKTTVDKYGLWLESAYNKTEAGSNDDSTFDNRHDTIGWTTGLDFNFGPGSNYYLNVQYAGEWVLGYDAATVKDYNNKTPTLSDKDYMTKATYRSMTQTLGSQSEQMMNSVTANVKFPLADAVVTPSFSGAVILPYNYDDTKATRLASAYLNPEVDWAPVDGVHVLFGADLSYGWVKAAGSSDVTLDTSTDKLGLYTPQNNVYVKVKFAWNGTVGNQ